MFGWKLNYSPAHTPPHTHAHSFIPGGAADLGADRLTRDHATRDEAYTHNLLYIGTSASNIQRTRKLYSVTCYQIAAQ